MKKVLSILSIVNCTMASNFTNNIFVQTKSKHEVYIFDTNKLLQSDYYNEFELNYNSSIFFKKKRKPEQSINELLQPEHNSNTLKLNDKMYDVTKLKNKLQPRVLHIEKKAKKYKWGRGRYTKNCELRYNVKNDKFYNNAENKKNINEFNKNINIKEYGKDVININNKEDEKNFISKGIKNFLKCVGPKFRLMFDDIDKLFFIQTTYNKDSSLIQNKDQENPKDPIILEVKTESELIRKDCFYNMRKYFFKGLTSNQILEFKYNTDLHNSLFDVIKNFNELSNVIIKLDQKYFQSNNFIDVWNIKCELISLAQKPIYLISNFINSEDVYYIPHSKKINNKKTKTKNTNVKNTNIDNTTNNKNVINVNIKNMSGKKLNIKDTSVKSTSIKNTNTKNTNVENVINNTKKNYRESIYNFLNQNETEQYNNLMNNYINMLRDVLETCTNFIKNINNCNQDSLIRISTFAKDMLNKVFGIGMTKILQNSKLSNNSSLINLKEQFKNLKNSINNLNKQFQILRDSISDLEDDNFNIFGNIMQQLNNHIKKIHIYDNLH